MLEKYGNITLLNGPDSKIIKIVVSADPIDLSWQHCGLTADFVSEFFERACEAGIDANDARHSISYLINEILENAIKFRHTGDVVIQGTLKSNSIEICIANVIDATTADLFQGLIAELLSRDPGELLLERIEQNASDISSASSGLGLLTLMSDYDARLGWTFEKKPEQNLVQLETFAALTLS